VYEPPPWERREREAAARPETEAARARQPTPPPSPSDRAHMPGAGLSSDVDGDELAPLGKHCWVVDSPGHPGRWPGLLLEWRKDPVEGEWAGRIAVVGGSPGDRRPVEVWVSARYLRSA
jgi:hypothetical protein